MSRHIKGGGRQMEELFRAIQAGDRARVERLLDGNLELAPAREPGGVSAVLTALYHGKQEIADRILAYRPTLDVFEAAAAGDVDRLRALLEGDRALSNVYASDGFTPLGLAAFSKRREAVHLLLEHGADPSRHSRNSFSFAPLHSAVADDSDVEIARMLLDAGAPVDARNGQGGTALHTAAFTGHRQIVELLLERGADAHATRNDGKTPAGIARERGHIAIAGLLEGRRGSAPERDRDENSRGH